MGLNIDELNSLYNEVSKSVSNCAHESSLTNLDENSVYHFNCPECGLRGMGDYIVASKLGWLTKYA